MKISREHYQFIVDSLAKLPPEQLEKSRHNARITYKTDLQENFRWRLFRCADLSALYKMDPSYNDFHIDTALKKAVKELGIAPA